jgi:hypothetical protein
MKLLFLLGMFALASPIFEHQAELPIRTTICAIKTSPAVYNGKLVEVSGYATHGAENSMFEDPTCFWGKQYPGTWMQFGGAPGTRGVEPKPLMVQGVGVVLVHDAQFATMDRLLHSSPGKDVSVKATVRARFFVTPEMLEGRHDIGKGYGKRNCCMLLAIEQVTAVTSKSAEPSIFDLAKAHKP